MDARQGRLAVGVDAGGTHTRALVASGAETVLGRGEAGPGNPHAVGFTPAVQHIEQALQAALTESGVAEVPRVVMGLAGGGLEADRARVRGLLAARLGVEPAQVRVLPDVALLLPAAGLAWGMAIVAGTGSSAYGVAPDGRTATVGGWGYLLGDEGSAYAVGRAAARAVAQADDGIGPPTALTGAVLDALRLKRPRDLIPTVYHSRDARTTLACLAPVVVACAEAGDLAALAILDEAAVALADLAAELARRLGLPPDAPVVCAGGLFASGAPLLDRLEARLRQRAAGHARLLEQEPAIGAVRLALASDAA